MAAKIDASFYRRRPARVAFDIARSWAIIAAAVTLALHNSHPAVWIAMILIIGSQQYALHIVLHDGLHGSLFATTRGTDLACRTVLCYPLFNALNALRKKHMAHHRYLGTPEDPDRYYHCTTDKTTRAQFLLFLTAFRSSLLTVIGAIRRKFFVQATAPEPATRATAGRKDRIDWILVGVVQVLFATLFTSLGGWLAYPLLWVLPFGFGVFVVQNLRSFAEHAQPEPDELADDHREITYTSNRLERIFFAPNNMNHHAEHHLFPKVPYYHLPTLRTHLEQQGRMDRVEYRKSYIGFILRYWLALPIPTTIGPVDHASVARQHPPVLSVR